jgi:sulfur relay (sulfurtransferase) complex TusBCD TusD component (DsrE family)
LRRIAARVAAQAAPVRLCGPCLKAGGVLQHHIKAKVNGRKRIVREDQLDGLPT